MAKRRRPEVEVDMGSVLRRELIDKFRAKCDRESEVTHFAGGCFVSPWPRVLARLEAGEAVEIHVFQLPAWIRGGDNASPRVRVEPDGSLTPLHRR